VAPEKELEELMYQPMDSEVTVFDQDHPLQVATVPITGDCHEFNPLMLGYVLIIGRWKAGIRELLESDAVEPPSPDATDLQYKYFPPQAVKLVAPKVRVFPVPIRVVGSEKELSPIHHSLLTELKELNVPGLHEMLTFPLMAADGIFEITGRERLDGGGL